MSRILLAALSALLLVLAGGTIWLGHMNQTERQSPAQAAPASTATLHVPTLPHGKRIMLSVPGGKGLTLILSGAGLNAAPLCRRGEKLCTVASYITWCCRADQQCETSTIGGCR